MPDIFFCIFLTIFIVAISLFFVVALIDGNRFVVNSYKIHSEKMETKHKFVVLADLHNKTYGNENCKLLNTIDKISPEGILVAGDLLTAKPGYSFYNALKLIEALSEKYPIYYGMGNHETRMFLYPETYGDMGTEYETAVGQYGVSLLKNKSVALKDNIIITGLDMDRKYYRRFRKTEMDREYLEHTVGEKNKDAFQILLAHNPDYFEEYSAWGADLVLSGHIHGGMMRLPFFGGVISPAFRLFPKYDGGLFEKGESKMILSRGLGMHTIPVRIFNPGELVVIEIVPAKK